jgi:hypothetical protein
MSNYVAGRDFTTEMLLTFSNGKPFQGRAIWKMADLVLALLKKALSLVTQLSPKIAMIDTTCRVVGYASGKTDQLFLQATDKGMYKMDKSDRMGLSLDDDDKLGFSGDVNNGDDSVVVVDSDVDSLLSNLKDGVIAPLVTVTPVSCRSFVLVRCRSSIPQSYQWVDQGI